MSTVQITSFGQRTWSGEGVRRTAVVEFRHPTCGLVERGRIRLADVENMTGAGPAGHLIWRITDYDARDLGEVTGDYTTAEQKLLAATRELDD